MVQQEPRKKSSVVVNIIIPETLIRASRGSGTGNTHKVPVQEGQGALKEKRPSQQSRLGSTAQSRLGSMGQSTRLGSTTPIAPVLRNDSWSAEITEPKYAYLPEPSTGKNKSTSAF